MSAPFSLTTSSSVWAKVVATNRMGSSAASAQGNGAVITYSTVPSPPVNLKRDDANTLSGQITLTWDNGSSDGG
jgi:hypothetical protein